MFRLPVMLLQQRRPLIPVRLVTVLLPFRPWGRRRSDPPKPREEAPTETKAEAPVIPLTPISVPPPTVVAPSEPPLRDTRDLLDLRDYGVTQRVLHQFVRKVLGFTRGLAAYLREVIDRMRRNHPKLWRVPDPELREMARTEVVQRVHEEALRHPTARWREEPTHRGNWARFFRGPNRREFALIVSADRPQVIGLFLAHEFLRNDHDSRRRKPRYQRSARAFH